MVLITCSIHAMEVASSHTAVQSAYGLLTDESPKLQAIGQNTIVVLVPSLNFDGVDIVTHLYGKTLNTQFEATALPVVSPLPLARQQPLLVYVLPTGNTQPNQGI